MLSTLVPNAAVRRRLMFASTFIPKEYPAYLDTVLLFARAATDSDTHMSTAGAACLDDPEFKRKLAVAIDNTRTIYPTSFASDHDLTGELVHMKIPPHGKELGVVLVSNKSLCSECGSSLITRLDRPSQVTVYCEVIGTTAGKHYHKICKNSKCKIVQHFGYTTNGLNSCVQYDRDWEDLPYFVSSQETVFATALLRKMDSELLIGQVSYNQKADIYNHYHGYYNVKKQNSKLDAKKKSSIQSDEISSQCCSRLHDHESPLYDDAPGYGRYVYAFISVPLSWQICLYIAITECV